MGVELFLLLAILLTKAQRLVSPSSVATEAEKKAREAQAEAQAAAARGDQATAAQKQREAAAHQQTAQTAAKAASTPPPWPQVLPAELPPYPGPGWKPASPVTQAMSARAWQLLPQLWQYGEGTWKAEKTADRWVVYRATQMADKRGVVAYTSAAATAPGPTTAPRAQAQAQAPKPPAPAPAEPDMMPTGDPMGATLPVAAPVAAPRASAALPTLKLASPLMSGPSVVWLQQRLGIKADGKFGAGTKGAVVAFQTSHGLKPDGIVGPATWKALGIGAGGMAA